jgi:carboxyl-terminal processing protease
MRQLDEGRIVEFEMLDTAGTAHKFKLPSDLKGRYLPRLPVPIEGIRDSANVSWKMLSDNIGYIYVRRIRDGLETALDRAVSDLKDARGLIVDVRGNTGGGFDRKTSHVNFYTDLVPVRSTRPQYRGPMAVLIDNRCISAGEGWASWFIANKRARFFGQTTAGASAAKEIYLLKNGLYQIRYPVRPFHGFLDRPIERRGLEPDVEVIQNAADLSKGRDTVLEAAREYLLNLQPTKDN